MGIYLALLVTLPVLAARDIWRFARRSPDHERIATIVCMTPFWIGFLMGGPMWVGLERVWTAYQWFIVFACGVEFWFVMLRFEANLSSSVRRLFGPRQVFINHYHEAQPAAPTKTIDVHASEKPDR